MVQISFCPHGIRTASVKPAAHMRNEGTFDVLFLCHLA